MAATSRGSTSSGAPTRRTAGAEPAADDTVVAARSPHRPSRPPRAHRACISEREQAPTRSRARANTMAMPEQRGPQPEAQVVHRRQAGNRPCLRGGFCWTLVRSSSRARISRWRVSRGSMTSSIWPDVRGPVRVEERLPVLAPRTRPRRRPDPRPRAISRAVQDPDGGVRAHHRDLRPGPGERDVRPHLARAHRDVGAAHRLAGHDRDLGDGGLAVRVDDLGAVADDAPVLLVRAGQEARAVHERDRPGCCRRRRSG